MLIELLWAAVGLGFTLGMGHCAVPFLMRTAARDISLNAPSPRLEQGWKELRRAKEGGRIIGWLERTLFFVALLQPSTNAGSLVIGGWLTFKLGAKWQIRSHLLTMPDSLPDTNDVDYLIARTRLASHIFVTFIVGTLANILLALVGVGVTAFGRHLG